MFKGILIDPFTKTVAVHEFEDGIKPIHAAIQATCFDCVRVNTHHVMYVDDEGLFKKPQAFFMLGGGGPFAGRALITGVGMEGETTDCALTIRQIAPNVVWREHIEVGGWSPPTQQEVPGFGFHITGPKPKFTPK